MDGKRTGRSPGIQFIISISFTIVALAGMIFLSALLYRQFMDRYEQMAEETSEQLLGQTVMSLEDYLRNMRRISDAMYYSVIKATDLALGNVVDQMDLLYEANKDKLVSIACYYSGSGVLTGACPISTEKASVDVRNQEWFQEAKNEPENFHFSAPHVQNLFNDPSYRYHWVISLSRAVELTRNGVSNQGILLVDMNFSGIVQLLDKANAEDSDGYIYLMNREGEIFYHPELDLIRTGISSENTEAVLSEGDGSFREADGGRRIVNVKTVAYTGWKLVRVVPLAVFESSMARTRYLVIFFVALALAGVILINQLISARLTMPLRKLNRSVELWEGGSGSADIYVGGSAEVEHLGRTLRRTAGQVRELMDDIVVEQEEKRKSELDALQSQINPHFLYNTLDSIVWMITAGRQEDAVFMVKQLASLFRISLSRGKTIIPLREEFDHARHYMNIQKARYKNDFKVEIAPDEDILDGCTVKLILQPLLENAIYYGMEYMDDEGEIFVGGRRDGDDVVIEVTDNGPGMPSEEAEKLLTGESREPSKGSGVGLINVHNRIKLRFGEQYGLRIESRPDEGMKVEIRLPYVPATKGNLEALEAGSKPADCPDMKENEVAGRSAGDGFSSSDGSEDETVVSSGAEGEK